MSMHGDYWIVDEDGNTYGCYDTFVKASEELERLYDDPFISNSKEFTIELM